MNGLVRTMVLVALLGLPSGCAVRLDFVRPSGERLSVVDDPSTPGGAIGVQGGVALDEESFYRIAGDASAVQNIDAHRRSGRPLRIAGGVLTGLGTASVALGMFYAPWPPDSFLGSLSGGGLAMLGLGAAGVVAGLALELVGEARAMDPELRVVADAARMRRAAEDYNLRLRARPRDAAPADPPEGGPRR